MGLWTLIIKAYYCHNPLPPPPPPITIAEYTCLPTHTFSNCGRGKGRERAVKWKLKGKVNHNQTEMNIVKNRGKLWQTSIMKIKNETKKKDLKWNKTRIAWALFSLLRVSKHTYYKRSSERKEKISKKALMFTDLIIKKNPKEVGRIN